MPGPLERGLLRMGSGTAARSNHEHGGGQIRLSAHLIDMRRWRAGLAPAAVGVVAAPFAFSNSEVSMSETERRRARKFWSFAPGAFLLWVHRAQGWWLRLWELSLTPRAGWFSARKSWLRWQVQGDARHARSAQMDKGSPSAPGGSWRHRVQWLPQSEESCSAQARPGGAYDAGSRFASRQLLLSFLLVHGGEIECVSGCPSLCSVIHVHVSQVA